MSNPVNFQDWETVTFKKRPDKKTELKQAERSGQIESVRRIDNGNRQLNQNINAAKIERLEANDEKITLKTIDSKAVDAIKRKRCELKLNQKELANKAQIPEAQLKNIEQGKELHNPQLLNKLQKALNIKLMGANISEALHP